MSILDPDFLTELEEMGVYGERTLAFVKKVAKGIKCINVNSLGGSVFGTIETGDGETLGAVTLMTVKAVNLGSTIAVSTGTAVAGSGTANVALSTTSDGEFAVTVTGLPCAIEISVDGGISRIMALSAGPMV